MKRRVCMFRRRQWTMRPWSGGTEPLTEREEEWISKREQSPIARLRALFFVFLFTVRWMHVQYFSHFGGLWLILWKYPRSSRAVSGTCCVYAVWLIQIALSSGSCVALPSPPFHTGHPINMSLRREQVTEAGDGYVSQSCPNMVINAL